MAFPRRIEAVVFDMDGLILDSEAAWRDAMTATAEEMGRSLPMPTFLSLIGGNRDRTVRILGAHFGEDFDLTDYLDRAAHKAHRVLETEDCLKAGVAEMMAHLDALGLPKALCTSSGMAAVERHLRPCGLIDRFDALVTRESVTNGKPDPEPYLKAAAALARDPAACLALEDSHNGVRSAAAAGMMTVMVPDLLGPTDEMRSLALHVVDDLHAVLALIRA